MSISQLRVEKTIREVVLSYLTLSFVLLGLGVATLSILLLAASLVPLLALAFSFILKEPEVYIRISMKRELVVGEEADLEITLVSPSGLGPILVLVELPPGLRLPTGEGRITVSLLKTFTVLEHKICAKVRAVQSGRYRIECVEVHVLHPMLIRHVVYHVRTDLEILVKPRVYRVIRVRARPRRVRAITTPGAAYGLLGGISLEFREVRKYVPGDPPKLINWKATARLGLDWPLVNEYEREIMRRVILVPLVDLCQIISGYPVGEDVLSVLLSLAEICRRRGHTVYLPLRIDYLARYRAGADMLELASRLREVSSRLREVAALLRMLKHVRRPATLILFTYALPQNLDMHRDLIRELKRIRGLEVVIVDLDCSGLIQREEVRALYMCAKSSIRQALAEAGADLVFNMRVGVDSVPVVIANILSQARL